MKISSKMPLDLVLDSPAFKHLKKQYQALLIFNSQLITKIKKQTCRLREIEEARRVEIEELIESRNQCIPNIEKESILTKLEIGETLKEVSTMLGDYLGVREPK